MQLRTGRAILSKQKLANVCEQLANTHDGEAGARADKQTFVSLQFVCLLTLVTLFVERFSKRRALLQLVFFKFTV